jgi:hypothetical protein
MIFYILIVNPHVIGDTNRQRNIEMKADAKSKPMQKAALWLWLPFF